MEAHAEKTFLDDEVGNRIAIITSDARIDALVRDAFRHEKYDLITVADFAASQDNVIGTSIGIVCLRTYRDDEVIQYVRTNPYWQEYPLVALMSNEYLDESKQGYKWCYAYDTYLEESSIGGELVEFVRWVITSRDRSHETSREE